MNAPNPISWTPEHAFALFESRANYERIRPNIRQYRIDRMHTIMEKLGGVPPTPTVHIAGSKGKGSTAAYTTGLIAASGARVGLYTSPHIVDYRERFTVVPPYGVVGTDYADIEAELTRESRRVWEVVEEAIANETEEDELPTTFELLTALAFCLFDAAGCDWVVLETGLGGRLDATNVCQPQLAIITPIELEHTDYLGDTLEKIATEKAGIIKAGIPVLSARQHKPVTTTLGAIARERAAPLTVVDAVDPPIEPAMSGSVQYGNIALARAAASTIGIELSPSAVARVVQTTALPGRGETIGRVILDGAHTPESLTRLLADIESERPVVVFGISRGKRLAELARVLAGAHAIVYVCRGGVVKPENPELVAASLKEAGVAVRLERNPATALDHALSKTIPGEKVIVTGSLYLVAELRPFVLQFLRDG